MATSLNASGVLFNDSSTQATAFVGGRGRYSQRTVRSLSLRALLHLKSPSLAEALVGNLLLGMFTMSAPTRQQPMLLGQECPALGVELRLSILPA